MRSSTWIAVALAAAAPAAASDLPHVTLGFGFGAGHSTFHAFGVAFQGEVPIGEIANVRGLVEWGAGPATAPFYEELYGGYSLWSTARGTLSNHDNTSVAGIFTGASDSSANRRVLLEGGFLRGAAILGRVVLNSDKGLSGVYAERTLYTLAVGTRLSVNYNGDRGRREDFYSAHLLVKGPGYLGGDYRLRCTTGDTCIDSSGFPLGFKLALHYTPAIGGLQLPLDFDVGKLPDGLGWIASLYISLEYSL